MTTSSINLTIPSCAFDEGEQTTLSVGLRITACALGTLAVVAGILVLWGIPGLSSLGNVGGWTILSAGAAVTLAGTFIGCFKQEDIPEPPTHPEHQPKISRASVIDALPPWLKNCLPANIPYVELKESSEMPKSDVSRFDVRRQTRGPLTLFAHGLTRGLCMEVTVTHEPLDRTYDRSIESHQPIPMGVFTTSQPLPIYIVIINHRLRDDTLWTLEPEDTTIAHRHASYSTGKIFAGSSTYRLVNSDSLSHVDIESQDHLPGGERYDLRWVIERLFKKGHLKLREMRTDQPPSFDGEAIGYWKIERDWGSISGESKGE